MSDLTKLRKDLRQVAIKEKATFFPKFFKTAKGQYGHGDVFIGVIVPEQRKIAAQYANLKLSEIKELLHSKIHEERMVALLILILQYKKGGNSDREIIVKFYIENLDRVNNWDLVDISAPKILGLYLHTHPAKRKMLYTLAKSKNLWEKRIAIISTHAFIREGEYTDTLKIAEILLHDPHDLIHKAVGWMLREVGNRNLAAEEKFLQKYAHVMPRTALRYAIEKFPEKKRLFYMRKKD